MAFVAGLQVSRSRFAGKRAVSGRQRENKVYSAAASRVRMLVLDATSTSEMDQILQSADENLVVVDYSTSWCGPCKKFAPVFEELSDKYKDVVFVKVMGDATAESSELMKREGIRAVPAFHFWKQQQKVLDFTGARMDELERNINELK